MIQNNVIYYFDATYFDVTKYVDKRLLYPIEQTLFVDNKISSIYSQKDRLFLNELKVILKIVLRPILTYLTRVSFKAFGTYTRVLVDPVSARAIILTRTIHTSVYVCNELSFI